MGDDFFKICYPKTFKNSNKFGVSTLLVMVKRGNEVEIEYSKNQIINKMNSYFGYKVVEKLKLLSFDDSQISLKKVSTKNKDATNNKYIVKLINIKNNKIKKSLIKLSDFFKPK